MKFSDNIGELSKALTEAQAELYNPFNTADNFFKSKYPPLSDVLNIVRPILAKHGLCIVQEPIGEAGGIGVETLILHRSGQYILCEPYYLPLAKNDAQTAGGAVTYARRYALNAVLGISGEDDDYGNKASGQQGDGLNKKGSGTTKQPEPKQKEPVAPLACPKCGVVLTAITSKGRLIQPDEIIRTIGMCSNCYHEQEESKNTQSC